MSEPLLCSTPVLAAVAPKKRSIVYIDGFNFYYGMLAERPDLKWLNYQRLAELLRPDDEILKVRLFTTVVDQDHRRLPGESSKHDRQSRILAALRTQPKITITPGKFSDRERECLVSSSFCSVPKGPRRKYWAREEKQTDVQLALQIVLDVQEEKAAGRQLDNIVLISGDIDMLPALTVAFQQDKKVRAAIYIPVHEAQLKNRRKDEFTKYCDPVKPIPEKYLRLAQFPDVVELRPGVTVGRPSEWPKPVPPLRPPSA